MKSYNKLPINVRSFWEEDFDNGFLTIQAVASGTGAIFGAISSLSANKNATGLGQSQTGTTATASVRTFTTSSNIEIGGGVIIFCTRVGINPLFDVTNDGLARFGLGNIITATRADQDHTQGIYFEYDRSLSANWRLCTASGSIRTKNDSGIAVAVGYVNICFIVNEAGTSVQFYINGIAVGTPITTNLPFGLAIGYNGYIHKKAGTTNYGLSQDYVQLQKLMNKSR